MKNTLIITLLLLSIIGCGPVRVSQVTRDAYTSGKLIQESLNSKHYLIVVTNNTQMPLLAAAMPDTFRLSDYNARIFHADSNGHIKIPKDTRCGTITIHCRGYLPQDLRVEQLSERKKMTIILEINPNKTGVGDGI